MTNKPEQLKKCLITRHGTRYWLSQSESEALEGALQGPERFLSIQGDLLNKTEILGVLEPARAEEMENTKAGKWKCKNGYWHQRGEKCTPNLCPAEPRKVWREGKEIWRGYKNNQEFTAESREALRKLIK